MTKTAASAPLSAPREGRTTAAFAGRTGVLLAILPLLLLFAGPAGLATPCTASPGRCPGSECGGPACPGCAGAERSASVPVDDAGAPAPATPGCSCGQTPCRTRPDAAVLSDRGVSSPASGNVFVAWLAPGATAHAPLSPGATGSGSPPAPREPLYLRHCVLRN